MSVALTIGTAVVAAHCSDFVRVWIVERRRHRDLRRIGRSGIAAVLPNHPLKERATLFTVLGVSALSTFAMIGYPMLAQAIGLDARESGVFIGATIHDVAQVVGAGYSMSPETGDVATVVKLLRVAMLSPVIVMTVISYRKSGTEPGGSGPRCCPVSPLVSRSSSR